MVYTVRILNSSARCEWLCPGAAAEKTKKLPSRGYYRSKGCVANTQSHSKSIKYFLNFTSIIVVRLHPTPSYVAMQTILGASGQIGQALARALPAYTSKIRLVSRRADKKANPTDELFKADLLDAAAVDKAVQGSEVVYLTPGLEYKATTWEDQWPRIMKNTIDACGKHGAKLVFFDNIYMYDPASIGFMTEENPVAPLRFVGLISLRA